MDIAYYLLAIVAGFILLIWSADKFVDGAADIANHLGVSPLIIGIIVMGFGTSAPEMLVSGVAAVSGNPQLGIGNAIGSNIANIAMVLGFTTLIYALPVDSKIIRREIPILLAAEIAAFALIKSGYFTFIDGALLMGGLFLILIWLIIEATNDRKGDKYLQEILEEEKAHEHTSSSSSYFWAIGGLVILLISSHMLVWGASNVATLFGISQLVIGLTIVAIGTSLPELAATIMSAKKGETDLAVGNIVGSNLFNTLGVLAIPALLGTQVKADPNAIYRDFPIMIILTILLLIFARGCWQKKIITWWKGAILVSIFIGYGVMLYFHTINKTVCETYLCL